MELDPKEYDRIVPAFLKSWPLERVENMTIEEYANLGDHDSFCYWLEYGTKTMGAIGGIALHKFELWKPKDLKDFTNTKFTSDGKHAWNPKRGRDKIDAFETIRALVVQIISLTKNKKWSEIDQIPFHSIGKWKIAFLYSDKSILPIYSKESLLAITSGLGKEFHYRTPVSVLQEYILSFQQKDEDLGEFAAKLYSQFAEKIGKRNYYLFGSKYGDENGEDKKSVIDDFISNGCVAIGFLDWIDFSGYFGKSTQEINTFVDENWFEKKPAAYKIKRYFNLLSKIKEGDIIAVKSHGSHNQLTIIAYAEVVKRNGSVYSYHKDLLGHQIHVNFLDANFRKNLGLTYAETLHQLTPKKDKLNFQKVFGWYSGIDYKENENLVDNDNLIDEDVIFGGGYNKKSEDSFQRNTSSSSTVNLIHNKIQNRFLEYLNETFPADKNTGEKRRIDAIRESSDEIIIYEIKPFENVYSCIREGIGQLLDYHHKLNTKKNKRIFIVGPNKPETKDTEFIKAVKTALQIPFGYIAFNHVTLEVEIFN